MIYKISFDQKYQPKITGLGDIYEQISVERRRKILAQKFEKGTLFLASNWNHGGRGLTLEEQEEKVCRQGYSVVEKGFVDSPPWSSRPRPKGTQSPFLSYPILVFVAPFIFRLLVALEFLWQGLRNSHMVYVFGQKRRGTDG